jgi:hypothetical protein
MPGGNPTRDNRMGMTVHNVREVLRGLPPCSKYEPDSSHALKNPIKQAKSL